MASVISALLRRHTPKVVEHRVNVVSFVDFSRSLCIFPLPSEESSTPMLDEAGALQKVCLQLRLLAAVCLSLSIYVRAYYTPA